MQSPAATVTEYLASLPEERRHMVEAVRKVILDNLDGGYSEGMQYGMIGYAVPHSVFPPGYHCDPKQPLPFAGIGSQKHYLSIYLMGLYAGGTGDGETSDELWFRDAWAASGQKKLDMGKACVRVKKLEDIALDVIGEAIRRLPAALYIERYQKGLAAGAKGGSRKRSA
jgi:hypothetical protein